MTSANGGADSLGRLLTCPVFYDDVLIGRRPSLFLVATGLEDALVGED